MQVLPEGMLMKSLSRPGPGKSRGLFGWQLGLFQVLGDVSRLI